MKTLNQLINIIILFVAVALALWWGFSQRAEKIRFERNFKAEKLYRDQEREITGRELKEMYSVTEKLQKELKIKPKQVIRWMQGEISYQDTGSTTIITRPNDTILVYPDSIHGKIEKSCYTLDLLLYKGVFVEQLNYRDSLQVMLYRERPKKFLFIKFGKWVNKAVLYSTCRDSTYKVFDNIKIRGR